MTKPLTVFKDERMIIWKVYYEYFQDVLSIFLSPTLEKVDDSDENSSSSSKVSC